MSDVLYARLLIVDDQQSDVLFLKRVLNDRGYRHVESMTSSREVVERFERRPPDLLLLNPEMHESDGFALMGLLKRWTASETHVPVLVISADVRGDMRQRAAAAGARDFVAKPPNADEVCLRISNLLQMRELQIELQAHNEQLEGRVRHRTWELDCARREAFERLALAAEYRDDETRQHTQRVGAMAAALAAEVGFAKEMVEIIREAAALHDLGKVGIADEVLLKAGSLNSAESLAMKKHCEIGATIMAGSSAPQFGLASDIALSHHERWDGTGYPRGLAGEAIPLPGRLVALADAFDAMTHDRPYKEAMTFGDAIAEIDRCSGRHFDPAVVEAFHRLDDETLSRPASSTPAASLTRTVWEALGQMEGQTGHGSTAATDALLQAAFDNTPVAVVVADDQRRLVLANRPACQMLGVSLDQLRELRIDDFAPPELCEHVENGWLQFLSAGALNSDVELSLPDGSAMEVSQRSVAHFLPSRHLSLLEPQRAGTRPTSRSERSTRLSPDSRTARTHALVGDTAMGAPLNGSE